MHGSLDVRISIFAYCIIASNALIQGWRSVQERAWTGPEERATEHEQTRSGGREMGMRCRRSRWPDYGQDVPGVVRGLALGGGAGVVVGAACHAHFQQERQWGAAGGGVLLAGAGALSLGLAGLLVYLSRVAKVRERDDLL